MPPIALGQSTGHVTATAIGGKPPPTLTRCYQVIQRSIITATAATDAPRDDSWGRAVLVATLHIKCGRGLAPDSFGSVNGSRDCHRHRGQAPSHIDPVLSDYSAVDDYRPQWRVMHRALTLGDVPF